MKNEYRIVDENTIIYLRNSDGIITGEAVIDTDDLPQVLKFPNSWRKQDIRETSEVRGTYKDDGKKVNITLQRYILNFPNQTIYHLDGNKLNNCRSNLSFTKPIRGNDYITEHNTSLMVLSKRNGEKIEVKIDTEDIEKMKEFTWISEWHNDINNYLINTVIYGGDKQRKKLTLQNFLLENASTKIVTFINGNRLDFRRSNLVLGDIKNKYEIIGDFTEIYLNRNNGLIEKTLIDTEDLEKLRKYGYTWNYYIGKHAASSPYVVGNNVYWESGKRISEKIYLHRIIMDCPDDKVIDHINHDTLDNRKSNLRIVSKSENQQNRKGARKGNKSGVRGVSWDEKNKDWIVSIQGTYLKRTKDKDEAEKMADEEIKKLYPYSVKYYLEGS
jgi:hypothetical protein